MRRTVEAVLYLVKTGCHWRLLPKDFPPWRTVYEYFVAWRERGVLRRIQRDLYHRCRGMEGRHRHPSIAIIDTRAFALARWVANAATMAASTSRAASVILWWTA